MHRPLASVGAFSLLVAAGCWAAPAAPGPPVPSDAGELEVVETILPRLPGGDPAEGTAVRDINEHGQIVGGSNGRPVLWEGGTVTDVAPSHPEAWSAFLINDAGQMALYSGDDPPLFVDDGEVTPMPAGYPTHLNERGQVLLASGVWHDGTLTPFTPPAEWTLAPRDLSDDGHVTGCLNRTLGDWDDTAILWRAGRLTRLGVPRSCGAAVNASGQVAGYSGWRGGFLWHEGRTTWLGRGLHPTDINERGQIAGYRIAEDGSTRAFVWDDGETTHLGFGGPYDRAELINERGQVAGYSATPDETLHLFLWSDGHLYDLTGAGYLLKDLNDRGQVIGDTATAGNPPEAHAGAIWELR